MVSTLVTWIISKRSVVKFVVTCLKIDSVGKIQIRVYGLSFGGSSSEPGEPVRLWNLEILTGRSCSPEEG
jgi:hypothetical protein